MNPKLVAVTAGLALGAGGAMAQGTAVKQDAQRSQGVVSMKPDHTKSMEKLQQAAQRLRESIQAMAQKQPGPDRDRAIDQAQEALLETQRAMVALPPELRSRGTVSTAGYDESVRELTKAADRLRESIQAMAQQKPGERRNQAMEQARQALWDTQQAMVFAYDPAGSASRGGASTGAGARKPK